MPADVTKDFFLGAVDNKRDPVKSTRWRMLIPGEIILATGVQLTNQSKFNADDFKDDFALEVKKVKIPGIEVETKTVDYMGFKTHHAVNSKIDKEFPMTIQMFEDHVGYEAMVAWQQSVLNTGLLVDANNRDEDRLSVEQGLQLGLGNHKDQENPNSIIMRNKVIKLEQYNWNNGEVIKTYSLINAFPKSIGGNDLSHSDANILQYDCTLQCDRWTVSIAKDYRAGL
jgi:hypothetical protein